MVNSYYNFVVLGNLADDEKTKVQIDTLFNDFDDVHLACSIVP